MIIFIPCESIPESIEVLDSVRLRKQVLEAYQILKMITAEKPEDNPYFKHPGIKMWLNYHDFVREYINSAITEMDLRGLNHSFKPFPTKDMLPYELPPWFFNKKLRLSHQIALLRKQQEDIVKAEICKEKGHIGRYKMYINMAQHLWEQARLKKFPLNANLKTPYYWPTEPDGYSMKDRLFHRHARLIYDDSVFDLVENKKLITEDNLPYNMEVKDGKLYVYLSKDEYKLQLSNPNVLWHCPNTKLEAWFDDEYFEDLHMKH